MSTAHVHAIVLAACGMIWLQFPRAREAEVERQPPVVKQHFVCANFSPVCTGTSSAMPRVSMQLPWKRQHHICATR